VLYDDLEMAAVGQFLGQVEERQHPHLEKMINACTCAPTDVYREDMPPYDDLAQTRTRSRLDGSRESQKIATNGHEIRNKKKQRPVYDVYGM
jgi:hypothetical protein